MPNTVTPTNGSNEFPVNDNEFYAHVEVIAAQELRNVKSTNRIEDGFFFYDLVDKTGSVISQMLIDKAKARAVDKTQCDMSPTDPSVVVRYFNNWKLVQYPATVRRADIRKIIANKGVGVEEFVDTILDTMTQGRDGDDFINGRQLILETELTDYTETLGGTPANMRGVLYAIRDMYDTLRTENELFTITGWKMGVPEEDIRIAVSLKLLNLIDVTELANIFNLSKVDLMGKLVVIPVSDLDKSQWYKVVVYDRHAFNHARYQNYIDDDKCASAGYHNFFLFDESMWFYSPLFKATSLYVSAAANAAFNSIITPTPEPEPEPEPEEQNEERQGT